MGVALSLIFFPVFSLRRKLTFFHCEVLDHSIKSQHCYASRGRYFEIQYLVNERVVPDGDNTYDASILMLNAEGSQRKPAELLINSNDDIHCIDDDTWAVLYHASYYESVEKLQRLAKKGVALHMKTSKGRTLMMLAARYSDRDIVELLIESGADIHRRDSNGWTLLHYASGRGWVEIVQCLVSKGVSLDVKIADGSTPLMKATEMSHKEVVELLMNSGSNIHWRNNDGWTILHYAARNGWVEIVQYLMTKGVDLNMKSSYGRTPLIIAAQMLQIKVVELLINSGANIHWLYNYGWTVLHYAASAGWVEIVQCLVSKGAALNVKDCCGKTPLMLALRKSHREVVLLLIKSGADIDGTTALHFASGEGMLKTVQCLVSKGVALNMRNTCGITPLLIAARRSHREIVELLIKSGADIHSRDASLWTVLHHALLDHADIRIVQLLLKKGVDIDAQTIYGKTPLHFTVQLKEIKFFDYLLKAGADCNLADDDDESPFNYLISQINPNVETIKLCIEKGAYVKPIDFDNLLNDPLLNKAILQDVKLCSQAVINKFNNKDLPSFYKKLGAVQKLPNIEMMKIGNRSGMVSEIEQAVTHEIKTKGFCNLLKIVPLVLSILCVKSSVKKVKTGLIVSTV